MDEKKTGLPDMENPTPAGADEPMADAMRYATRAQRQRAAAQEEAQPPAGGQAEADQPPAGRPGKTRAAQDKPARRFSKKKQGRRRKKDAFEEKADPYYGLKLKSREEYQHEYEQTLSFKPVRPEESGAPGEQTGTFTYLFDGSRAPSGEDRALEKRFEKMHEERRRRVEKTIRETGATDVAKADVFNITTAIPLDQIREAAGKGQPPAQGPKPPVPVREPEPQQKPPAAEPAPPAVREPAARPPRPRSGGHAVAYRPAGTPIHLVELDDLALPLFNEAKAYPRGGVQPPRAVPGGPGAAGPSHGEAAAPGQAEPRVPEKAGAPGPAPAAPGEAPADKPAGAGAPQQDAPHADPAPDIAAREAQPDNITPLPVPHADTPAPAGLPVQESPFARHTVSGAAQVRDAGEEEEADFGPKRRRVFQRRPAAGEDLDLPPEADGPSAAPQPAPEERRGPVALHTPAQARPDAELEDYDAPDDAPSVFNDLGGKLRELTLRLAVTGIAVALQAVFGFLGEFGAFGLPPLHITAYLLCSLVFLAVPVAFCHATVLNGLKALFRLRANADSAVAVAGIVGLVQGVTALFSQGAYQHGALHLYAVVVTGALFLNTCGKFFMVRRINRNFHFVASPEKVYTAEKFGDHNTALQLAEGCTLDTPAIAYQRETGFLRHFLRLSYSDDPSDRSSQFLAPVLFCASLALFLAVLLLTKDVMRALAAFGAATCVSTPVMNMLSVNLPLGRLSRVASQCGGMVVGFPAVQYFSDTNAVMVDAADLFPKGTVTLNGIKTFGGRQVDAVLVDAAALMQRAGGPLAPVFSQILHGRQDLPKVESLRYEDGLGLSAWVGGQRIFIGNRRLLVAHNITPPDASLEQKYLQGGKQLAYLAVGGDLVAMLIMTYLPDRHRATELLRMQDNGISLIVRSNDPNVTAPFLAAVFHLDAHTVRVLPERLGQVYASLTKEPAEKANALLATRGRPTTLMRLATACVRMRGNITIAVVMQTVGAVLGFALVAFLCCQTGGTAQVSTMGLLLYELFWSLAIWLVPRLHRP